MGVPYIARPAASAAASTITRSCGCSRRPEYAGSSACGRVEVSSASTRSNTRCALNRPSNGSVSRRANQPRSPAYATQPPANASTLIKSGALTPCHIARSNAGNASPSTAPAARSRVGPITCAGSTPTSTQASTSRPIGRRIQYGGSCGVRGNPSRSRPRNTPTAKRSE